MAPKMPQPSVDELRDAASTAHRRGDTESAVDLFQRIIELFPESPEAGEAVFYLTSIGRGPRRPAQRIHRQAEPAAGVPPEARPKRREGS